MSLSTTGIEWRGRSRRLAGALELLSSMRFSISLLTVICIASVIGTVVRQNEPFPNYVNQFGPFWAEVFRTLGLFSVYSAGWFLTILGFLVVSTSLCIARNAPKIVADLRTYKENVREQSLQAFHHKGLAESDESTAAATDRIGKLLVASGWRARVQTRPHGTMIAARRGASNRLGYLAAHSAIVLICIGGLADGDLMVRLQMAWQGKSVIPGGTALGAVGPEHRLGPDTPTFRANLLVPEGGRSGTAVINLADGPVLQQLPFDVELKKFVVDYYSTGMPKLFASDIVIHDRATGRATATTVKVNEPAIHDGIAIYQSSFDDGGSSVTLRGLPLGPASKPIQLTGAIGESTAISNGADRLQLEFTGLRVINVENLGAANPDVPTDVRRVDLVGRLRDHLGAGSKPNAAKTLRNVGPSVSYKLRDAAGQAREFNNYMLPVELDGLRVFLLGARERPDQPMRYLRIPADDQGRIDGWVRLRGALLDPVARRAAVARYVALATPGDKPELAEQLTTTAGRVLGLFAGAETVAAPRAAASGVPPAAAVGGLQAISDFIETSVPDADRTRISDVLLRILNGSLFELLNVARATAGQPVLGVDPAVQGFMTQAVLSLSDSFFYPAPIVFQLEDFKQVQASVFQVARAPGKTLVYLGAVLLIVGVFAMLYIRERRLWAWIAPRGDGSRVLVAMSTTRRTLDADAEFERLGRRILEPSRA